MKPDETCAQAAPLPAWDISPGIFQVKPVSSAAGDIMCMVSPFKTVPYAPASGRYMDFRWLQQCGIFLLVSVTKIDRREHVVPFSGKAARQAGDTRSHYLVNSGRFYEEDKDKALKIFAAAWIVAAQAARLAQARAWEQRRPAWSAIALSCGTEVAGQP